MQREHRVQSGTDVCHFKTCPRDSFWIPMKTIALFLLILLFIPCIFAQGIEGLYLSDTGERIVISGNKLYYMAKDKFPLQWWEKDTLAVCDVRMVDETLLEINSVSSNNTAPSVEYLSEERNDDSVRVHFIMPYSWDDLVVSVHTDYSTLAYRNVNHANDVIVPRCKKLQCSIRPTVRIAEHEKDKTYGQLFYEPFFLPEGYLELDKKSNRVDIKLPEVDNYFFSRYFVNHEYIYKEEDCLHWKGKIFKKNGDRNHHTSPLLTQGKTKNIDGVYVGQYGDRIEITNGHFCLIAKDSPHFPQYSDNTLAMCDVRRIDDHIIEISNKQLHEEYEKGIKASCIGSANGLSIPVDSILVHFNSPYHSVTPLKICIYTESDTITCDKNHEAYIPVSAKLFRCSVSPMWYRSFSIYNTYDGSLYYSSPTFDVKPSTRKIEVSMPALDDAFFERYYITSEYLYIKGHSIYWRGEKYKKK